MRARRPRFYNLRRPRIRQSWNKYNLFNLANFRQRPYLGRTFFQQKWEAKSHLRGYHGAHIRERDWARMFSRRIFSTVDLDPSYLAQYDGTEQSAGRGSGKQLDPRSTDGAINASNLSKSEEKRIRHVKNTFYPPNKVQALTGEALDRPVRHMTPYMQMTFAPLERRLDTAIFRAMFASSTLQARQFCVHGAVTVNGKKMRYPAYQLNPGDLFQVDPERVLFATGAPKNPKEVARIAKRLEDQEARAAAREAAELALREAKLKNLDAKLQSATGEPSESSEAVAASATEAEAEVPEQTPAADSHLGEDGEPMTEDERQALHKSELKRLVLRAKSILKDKDDMSARQKQRVRLFMAEAKRAVSRINKTSDDAVDAEAADLSRDAVMTHLANILKGMSLDQTDATEVPSNADEAATTTDTSPKASLANAHASLTPEEQAALEQLIQQDAENPYDESKPYLTPWRPRNFLAPFAFIPRYLEVNQNICAAIYLRHPVVRRGFAEVPTPFPHNMNQLVFNWYLRRR